MDTWFWKGLSGAMDDGNVALTSDALIGLLPLAMNSAGVIPDGQMPLSFTTKTKRLGMAPMLPSACASIWDKSGPRRKLPAPSDIPLRMLRRECVMIFILTFCQCLPVKE